MSPNAKNISATNKRPYCKVCHDAGKPESEYSTHWVKDVSGNTTCPTLLNTECRYCHKLGHTAKFCDVLAKINKEKEKAERRSHLVTEKQIQRKKPDNNSLVVTNGFAALCQDSDTEEEIVNIIKNMEPNVDDELKTTWASIVARPKPLKVEASFGRAFEEATNAYIRDHKAQPIIASWATNDVSKSLTQSVTKSWAYWTDSEDEDDETDDEIW
jgi:hypothetical protein